MTRTDGFEDAALTAAATSSAPPPARGVFIRTYGCQMNVYDSERMASLLRMIGYRETPSPEDAELVILNTCHIREKAAEKLYSDLGRLKRLQGEKRSAGGDLTLVVAGCVAQAEGSEILIRAPQVDMVVGPQAYHRLPEMLARAARERGEIVETDFSVEEKFDSLGVERDVEGPTAFLTIQEGCDKFCTFCVVPYTRGAEISRSVDAITAEARALARRGVREITLLGQNVNAWRAPPPGGGEGVGLWGLGELCGHLSAIDGIARIRFTTSHPRDMEDGLIAALGEVDALMPYLHLPVQAGSDRILAAMNRGHTRADYIDCVRRIRASRPDIALSGDFIVGFPGEEESDFEQTLSIVEEVGYAAAFSFKYSRRPGTPGAVMPKQVPEQVKEDRLARLQALLESQRQAFNKAQIGRLLPVLYEKPGRNSGQIVGRSPYLQSVHAEGPTSMIGSIAPTRIEGVTPNALSGVIVAEAPACKRQHEGRTPIERV